MEEIGNPQKIISNINLVDIAFGNCFARDNYEGMKDRAAFASLNKDADKTE